MPRIVKPGVIPEPVIPWQTTTPFHCHHCGCEWYADNSEWHKIEGWSALHHSAIPNEAECAGMDCPTCGTPCQIREPGKPIARGV
jgi:hypothetical protein